MTVKDGVLEGAPVPVRRIGTTGGDAVAFGDDRVTLADLRGAHEGFFPKLMSRAV